MSGGENPYPTFDAVRASQARMATSKSAMLLFIPVEGTVQNAIEVLSDPKDPDTRTPYYNQAAGTYHPISELPISEPKVSSITVRVRELEDWEENWLTVHWKHSEPDAPPDAFPDAKWGELSVGGSSDADDEVEYDGEPDLLRCCGQDRPRHKNAKLTIKPSKAWDGQDGGFVTVHDYVSAVHPWLVRLRGEILGAMGTLDGLDEPLGDEMELVVSCDALYTVSIDPRMSWIWHRKGLPVEEGLVGKLLVSKILTYEH